MNEVIVPVTVTDEKGELVLDLTEKDFHVFDNGVEQKINHWDLGGDQLAVALVIETSTRIKALAPVIHSMGSIFTETVMAQNGEAAVITYDSDVEVKQEFTRDHDAVGAAISGVKFQVPERYLYDAMAKAVELLKAQPAAYRRVMLVIGESQDDRSTAKLGEVTRAAAEANISIYAVGTSTFAADLRGNNRGIASPNLAGIPPIKTTGCMANGHPCADLVSPAIWLLEMGTVNKFKNHELEVAAAATGGVHYSGIRDSTIESALGRIGEEVHAQYILSYSPTPDPLSGFNPIQITVSRPNVTLRARPGYYVSAVQ